jgi:peroxiredoxin
VPNAIFRHFFRKPAINQQGKPSEPVNFACLPFSGAPFLAVMATFAKTNFMSIQNGQAAPDFRLFDTEKNEVKLQDLKGRNVVLLFFPLAFTSVCTAELCSIRDNYAIYNGLQADVFGISVDSVFTLKKFKEEQALNFSLLSDFNKEASAAYDSLYDSFVMDMKGVSKRSAFVIDKEGIIRYAQILDNAGGLPDFEAIQQTLKSLQ